ncbi:LysR family transcriptional regulator [Rhodobacteraceae bacterium NNCM2]|nr:LysR family transcriptional regulator [Coraliihabitans acroporae]
MPSLAALRAMEAAVRLGTFKAAAEELSVTPAAVSHQVKALEEQLDTTLFVRRSRTIEPSDACRRIAVAVNDGLERIRWVLEAEVSASRELVVSTTPAFASLFLVPAIGDFEAANPLWPVKIVTGTMPADLLRDRSVDVAIRYGAQGVSGLDAVPLPPERFGAFVAPTLERLATDAGTLALIETGWQRSALRPIGWQDWFLAAGGRPGKLEGLGIRRFDDEQQALHCAVAGQGFVLASNYLARHFVSLGLLKPFMPHILLDGFSYSLVSSGRVSDHPKVRKFRAWLVERLAGSMSEPDGLSGFAHGDGVGAALP